MTDAQPEPESSIREWLSCPVCASDRASTWVSFPEVEFVRCDDCSLVYKSRETEEIRPDDFYEKQYFHGRKSARDKRFEHRVGKARRQIESALAFTDAKSVLDVGCSFGYVMEAGKRLGLEAAGVDISEYAVNTCRERGYRAEVGTLDELPFEDGEFDVVVMKHVLEHTPCPKRALAEVTRITTKEAVVVIAVPSIEYWKGIFRRRAYRYFRPDDLGRQHYVYYGTATLARLLIACGFEVVAKTKAVFRGAVARRSPFHYLIESGRWLALATWQSIAGALLLRREVVMIARRQ